MLLTEQEIKEIHSFPWELTVDFVRRVESAVLEKLKAQEPVAIADGTFNHNCELGTSRYTHPLPPADVVRDAARYRFLRDEAYLVNPVVAVVWKRNDDRDESEWVNTADGYSLDCHIDAAMKEMK